MLPVVPRPWSLALLVVEPDTTIRVAAAIAPYGEEEGCGVEDNDVVFGSCGGLDSAAPLSRLRSSLDTVADGAGAHMFEPGGSTPGASGDE